MAKRVDEGDLFGSGGGGGGGGGSPTRTPDTLRSQDWMELVLGISNGKIKGLAPGVHNKLENFFVGDTPLYSSGTGETNFPDFNATFYSGDEMDPPIGFVLGGAASNLTVNVNLSQNIPVVRQTPQIQRGRIDRLEIRLQFNRLMHIDDDGTTEETARFRIEYKPSTSPTWQLYNGESETLVYGKTSAGAVKDFLINVPRLTDDDWQVRVTKLSIDNVSDFGEIVNMNWESMQMVEAGLKNYPNVAVAHLWGRATNQFSSIPEFSGVYDGAIVRVPTNYDPIARTYDESQPWDGSFKMAWTNNPAWVLYDLIVNEYYGLVTYYLDVTANRYDFYIAAKWCDEPVQITGTDKFQPRFTFNMYLTDARPGMDLLRYVAGAFNSTIFDDGNGVITLRTDQPRTPTRIFTPEDVSEDGFMYSFTDVTQRHNDITVSFANPALDWTEDRRAATIDNTELIARNGRIPLDFIAVGCTDVHEAVRRANYRFVTANTEITTVSFRTTRKALFCNIYDTIYIADPTAGWSTGGRIKSIDGNTVNLRDPIFFQTTNSVTMRLQTYNGIQILTVEPANVGISHTLTILSGTVLPGSYPDRTVFTLEDTTNLGMAKPFRIMSIAEVEGTQDAYDITAIEVNLNKYPDADSGTMSDPIPYSYVVPGEPVLPPELVLESGAAHVQISSDGTLLHRIFASWARPLQAFTDHYEIDYRQIDSGVWSTVVVPDSDNAYLGPIKDGQRYHVRLYAVAPTGRRSQKYLERLNYLASSKEAVLENPAGMYVIQGIAGWNVGWNAPSRESMPDYAGVAIRVGPAGTSTWETAIVVTPLTRSDRFTAPWLPAGTWRFYLKYIDTSGNESGTAATVDVSVTAPLQPIITGRSQLSVVYLAWQECQTDQPITGYHISVGPTLAESVQLSVQDAITYTQTVDTAGVRRYWVVAIDGAGNQSAPGYIDIEVHLTLEDAFEDLENQIAESVGQLTSEIEDIQIIIPNIIAQVGANDSNIQELVTGQKENADAILSESLDRLAQYEQLAQEQLQHAQEIADNASAISAETANRITQGQQLTDQVQQVADDLGTETQQRLQSIADLENQVGGRLDTIEAEIAGILGTEEYDPLKTYLQGSLVSSNNKLYRAKQDVPVNTPPPATGENAYWALIGDYTSLGAAVGDLASRMTQVEAVEANHATQLTNLTTWAGQAESAVIALQQTTADQATALTQLTSRTDDAESNITVLQQTQANQATLLTDLSTEVDGVTNTVSDLQTTTDSLAGRVSTIETEVDGQGSAITALQQTTANQAQSITSLTTRVGDAESDITTLQQTSATQATQLTNLTTRVGDAESEIETLQQTTATQATQLNSLTTRVGDAESEITSLQQTTAEQAQSITSLTTRTDDAESNITVLQQTTATQATQITNLQVQTNSLTTAFTQVAEIIEDYGLFLTELKASQGSHDAHITTLYEVTSDFARILTRLETSDGNNSSVITQLLETTAEQATQLTNLTTRTENAESSITSLQQTTSNMASSLSTLQTTVGDHTTKISSLEETTEDQAQAITSLSSTSSQHTTQITNIQQVNTQQATQISNLTTRVGDSESDITTLQQTTATQATQLTNLTTRVGDSESDISSLQQTTATQAQAITSLNTRVGDAETSLETMQETTDDHSLFLTKLAAQLGASDAQIIQVKEVAEGAAKIATVLQVEVGDNFAQVQQQVQTLVTDVDALASDLTTLQTAVGNNTSAIVTEAQTRASEDDALATQISTLQTNVNGQIATLQTQVQAASDDASAAVSAVTTLQTQVDGNTSSIQTYAEIVDDLGDGLNLMAGIKLQTNVNGELVAAGMGIGIENTPAGMQTYMNFLADRIVVLQSLNDNAPKPVFAITGGETLLNKAMIGEAYIEELMVADGAITSAKIANAAITSAKIQDAAITTAKIADATISTAKIGVAQIDTLRLASGSVVAGTSTAFSQWLGSSGDATAPLGNVGVYLPYGGTLICFLQVALSGGSWTYRNPRVIASINGNPIILDRSATYGTNDNNLVESFSYIYGPVGAGWYTMFVDGHRPTDGGTTYAGRMAILGFQR